MTSIYNTSHRKRCREESNDSYEYEIFEESPKKLKAMTYVENMLSSSQGLETIFKSNKENYSIPSREDTPILNNSPKYGVDAYENVKSLFTEPKSLIIQANTYVENVFGMQGPIGMMNRPLKLSSRQAVIVSRDSGKDVNDNYTKSESWTEHRNEAVQNKPRVQSRNEIYLEKIQQRKRSISSSNSDISHIDGNDHESAFSLQDSVIEDMSMNILYRITWNVLIAIVVILILIASCTQLAVFLPFLLLVEAAKKFNEIKGSRLLTYAVLFGGIYYAHKLYFLYASP